MVSGSAKEMLVEVRLSTFALLPMATKAVQSLSVRSDSQFWVESFVLVMRQHYLSKNANCFTFQIHSRKAISKKSFLHRSFLNEIAIESYSLEKEEK